MKRAFDIAIWGKEPDGLYGFEHEPYKDMRLSIQDLIEQLTLNKTRLVRVHTNGAQGTAQIAFWAAERAKRRGFPVENVLIQPWEGWDGSWAQSSAFGRDEYASILSKASKVETVGKPENDMAKAALVRRTYECLSARSELQFVFFRSSIDPRIGGKTLRAIDNARAHGKTPLIFDLDLTD